jgi:hypothetical protein
MELKYVGQATQARSTTILIIRITEMVIGHTQPRYNWRQDESVRAIAKAVRTDAVQRTYSISNLSAAILYRSVVMETKSNVINIDGKEYSQEDLDDSQTYLINQIKDLQGKSANLRFQLDQVSVAQSAFTNSLITSLKNEEVIENMNEAKN